MSFIISQKETKCKHQVYFIYTYLLNIDKSPPIWAICIVLPFSTKKTGLLEQNAREFNSSWKGSCICVYLYCLVSFCNVEFFTSASCSLLELNSFIDPGGLGFRSRFRFICCLLIIWVHVPFTYPLHALSSTDFFPLRQCYIWWKHMWACCCVYTVEKYPQLYIFLKTEIVWERRRMMQRTGKTFERCTQIEWKTERGEGRMSDGDSSHLG